MKRIFLMALFLASALIIWRASQPVDGPERPAGQQIDWLTSLPAALNEAKANDVPIMIDFYADWCGPCKMLDKQTYADARVASAATNWVSVKIDVDANEALAREYDISSIPTIVFLSPQGKELSRFSGFIPAQAMLQQMDHARDEMLAASL